MAEKPTPEALKAVYDQLNSRDLAAVQQGEAELARNNMQVLKDVAARVSELGLFPSTKAAFDSTSDRYDIREHPLMYVDADPETKNMGVFLDSQGELHVLHALSHWETDGYQRVVDFTVFERGVATNEHYMNFTKMAIRKLMDIVFKSKYSAYSANS